MTSETSEIEKIEPIVEIPPAYHLWRARLIQILLAYRNGVISDKDFEKYQLFLLETGQFNANFTLAELKTLDYPRAPFAIMDRGTYLRTTDTWAMQVLRMLYQKIDGNSKLHPIWVDSKLFWTELKRYCRVVRSDASDEYLQALVLGIRQKEKKVHNKINNYILIKIEKKEFINECNIIKKRIKNAMLISFFTEKKINPQLHDRLICFFEQFDHEEMDDTNILEAMKILFPEACQKVENDNKKFIGSLNLIRSKSYQTEGAWFQSVFEKLTAHKVLPKQINNPAQLKGYLKKNKKGFLELINNLITSDSNFCREILNKFRILGILSDNITNPYNLIQLAKNSLQDFEALLNKLITFEGDLFKSIFWKAKNYNILPYGIGKPDDLKVFSKNKQADFLIFLDTLIKKINDDLNSDIKRAILKEAPVALEKITETTMESFVFYVKEKFEGINAVITSNNKKIEGIIGCMGYHIDPVKVIRLVINKFPNLFFDADQTREFLFDYFIKTSQIKGLKKDLTEAKIIEELCYDMLTCIPIYLRLPLYNVFIQKNDFEDFYFLKILKYQLNNCSRELKIYCHYLLNFFEKYYLKLPENSSVRVITNEEIKGNIIGFVNACQQNNMAIAVRYAQSISEIMLLVFEEYPFKESITNIYKYNYLANYNVQGVTITPYAMRSFLYVFQLLSCESVSAKLNVYVTDQSYYEFLLNLSTLNKEFAHVHLVQNVNEIKPEADICFLEIHPNNVLSSKQFSHDIEGLIKNIFSKTNKPRALVIDATLNFLNDSEIINLLNFSKPLVESGSINIIIIQSLTKFMQIGMDKRSGGVVVIINKGDYWSKINEKFIQLQQNEITDSSTVSFFSYFSYEMKNELGKYLQYINEKVCKTYDMVMKHLTELEVQKHNRFQLTINSDQKSCFLALNINGLLTLEQDEESVEKSCTYILNHLIYPLCEFYKLPLTERMSIGFPLSSISVVAGSVRLTIGLETEEQLKQYAEILAYASFVLNRENEFIFDNFKDSDTKKFLGDYFDEKVKQFKAMTPGSHESCEIIFYGETHYDVSLKRTLIMNNGIAKMYVEKGFNGKIESVEYKIIVPVRAIGDIKLSDNRITPFQRKTFVACFFDETKLGKKKKYQNSNWVLNNVNYHITLSSMEILGFWNGDFLYGPFNLQNKKKIYFHLNQKNISFYIDGNKFEEKNILVKQGDIITPLSDMPISDREYLIREGSYSPIRRGFGFDLPISVDMLYIPNKYSNINISIEDEILTVEHDFICVQKEGATVYKRIIDEYYSCFEINYWKIKNPVIARLMRLLTVVYIKENYNIAFNSRDEQYNHFMLKIPFDKADNYFTSAVQFLLDKEETLEDFIKFRQQTPSTNMENSQYRFQGNEGISWVSGYSGITFINDNGLLLDILKFLNKQKMVCFKTISFFSLKSLPMDTKFSTKESVDEQLNINGLYRGTATTITNNCLLDSYFQVIRDFLFLNLPNYSLGSLEDFISYVREKIGMTDDQMLMINDEEQGVQILSAIKQYIAEQTGLNVGFDLNFMVAMDNEVALIDNLSELENFFNYGDIMIPIKIIQINYNHYEPVFIQENAVYNQDISISEIPSSKNSFTLFGNSITQSLSKNSAKTIANAKTEMPQLCFSLKRNKGSNSKGLIVKNGVDELEDAKKTSLAELDRLEAAQRTMVEETNQPHLNAGIKKSLETQVPTSLSHYSSSNVYSNCNSSTMFSVSNANGAPLQDSIEEIIDTEATTATTRSKIRLNRSSSGEST